MGDRNLTLLELHFDGDTQFGPSGLPDLGSESESNGEGAESGSASEDEEEGRSPALGVLGLLALVLVVFAVKRLVGGEEGAEAVEA